MSDIAENGVKRKLPGVAGTDTGEPEIKKLKTGKWQSFIGDLNHLDK